MQIEIIIPVIHGAFQFDAFGGLIIIGDRRPGLLAIAGNLGIALQPGYPARDALDTIPGQKYCPGL